MLALSDYQSSSQSTILTKNSKKKEGRKYMNSLAESKRSTSGFWLTNRSNENANRRVNLCLWTLDSTPDWMLFRQARSLVSEMNAIISNGISSSPWSRSSPKPTLFPDDPQMKGGERLREVPGWDPGTHSEATRTLGSFWCVNVDSRVQPECVASFQIGIAMVRRTGTSGTSCVLASASRSRPRPLSRFGRRSSGKPSIMRILQKSPVSFQGTRLPSAGHVLCISILFVLLLITRRKAGFVPSSGAWYVCVALLVWPSFIAHMNYHQIRVTSHRINHVLSALLIPSLRITILFQDIE